MIHRTQMGAEIHWTILQTSNAEAADGTPKIFSKVLNHPDSASLPKRCAFNLCARKYNALMTYRKSKERATGYSRPATEPSCQTKNFSTNPVERAIFEPICRSLLKMI